LIDKEFYKNEGPFKLGQLADIFNCQLYGDSNFQIEDIATLELAKSNQISFLSNPKYCKFLAGTKAGAVITFKKYVSDKNKNYLVSENPYFTMAEVAAKFYPDSIYPDFFIEKKQLKNDFDLSTNISESVLIHKNASIGKNCSFGPNTVIGKGVQIGNNCKIGEGVSIYFSKISDNVKIYQGVKIGGEGFGFAIDEKNFKKIPQLGRVIIEDNVEIGCNSTIDRGSIGDTVIGKSCMIDNMVHVGHNVKIGSNCVIAAMTGISGSTVIGNNVMIGGQVGISGHVKVGNNVKIAAKSGVMKNISDNESVGGYPAENIIKWHRKTIKMKNS
tara:strand:+ start:342 stop:1328 length:987 start_codon:yes stop_codon:yes gene_type:complete